MKLTKDELLNKLKEHINEDTTDDTISLIEDITDTINAYEEQTKDDTKWKEKYEENDMAWRKKYKERFFSAPAKEEKEDIDIIEDKPKNLSYDDLFTTKE